MEIFALITAPMDGVASSPADGNAAAISQDRVRVPVDPLVQDSHDDGALHSHLIEHVCDPSREVAGANSPHAVRSAALPQHGR